jgi:TonB family protein
MRLLPSVAIALLVSVPCLAQSNAEAAKALEHEIKGHVFYLRGFPQGVLVRYEAEGSNPSGRAGNWSTHGIVAVEAIKPTDQGLEIKARRLLAIFDPQKKDFEFGKTTDRLLIRVPLQAPTVDAARKAMNTITLSKTQLPGAMPDYWQEYWKDPQATVAQAEGGALVIPSGVEKVGKEVKAPKPIHAPDPEFTEEARHYGIKGKPIFLVMIDESGNPASISLLRPAGAGFDEGSYAALRTWKFVPATKNGIPVKCLVRVEISFDLN